MMMMIMMMLTDDVNLYCMTKQRGIGCQLRLKPTISRVSHEAFDPFGDAGVVLLFLQATQARAPAGSYNPISLSRCIPTPVPRRATHIVLRRGRSDCRNLEMSSWKINLIFSPRQRCRVKGRNNPMIIPSICREI